jgi:hypothetical protein
MKVFEISLALLLLFSVGCGGGNSVVTPIAGPYEFVVTSNVTGGTTLVEANMVSNGKQSTAAGPSQVQILTYENKNWYLNGVCSGSTPGQNMVSAGVTGKSNVALTFDEGGNNLLGSGTLTGTTISGSYTVNGSNCPDLVGIPGFPNGFDSGGFLGSPTANLAGTFSGVLNLRNGIDDVTITLAENGSNNGLTVNASLTGPAENGTFTLSGSAVGNIMLVSGSVNGQQWSWLGYLDSTGRFTGTANSIQLFDYNTQVNAGLLVKQ